MISFESDYVEGAHPKILERLTETNFIQQTGYGNDEYSLNAKNLIKKACGREDVDIHLLVGGTQTNLIVISSILRPFQGVLSPITGHINVHETGAIEGTGHKVLILDSDNGKIKGNQIREYCKDHYESPISEHLVQPGMVYISHPTEHGTLYTKDELLDIKSACDEYAMPLFIDGARLGYGIASPKNDISLQDITNIADIYYIGGTKCGAFLGEAVVISNDKYKKDFRYAMKQRGALLAKGRLIGIQFETLFTDNLYFDICKNAVKYALSIREGFLNQGIKMFGESYANQQFPIVNKKQLDYLQERYIFEEWGPFDKDHTIIRFCTSWATKEEDVNTLLNDIKNL